jgi:hypothetical protein
MDAAQAAIDLGMISIRNAGTQDARQAFAHWIKLSIHKSYCHILRKYFHSTK